MEMKEEALALADYLDNNVEAMLFTEQPHLDRASAMIRRLVEENTVLENKLIDFSVRIKDLENLVTVERKKTEQAFARGCAHISKRYGVKMTPNEIADKLQNSFNADEFILPYVDTGKSLALMASELIRRLVEELNKQTKPLSDEEIKEVEQQVDKQYAEEFIYRQDEWVYLFARAIEERHGIK